MFAKQLRKAGGGAPKRAEAQRLHPDCRFVDFMMLSAEKHMENAARRKWKSRGVLLGHRLRNKHGAVIKEQLVHAVPSSVGMIRLGAGWALLTDSKGKRGA